MMMLVHRILMTMRMRMARAVDMQVFMLVKDDGKTPSKGICDTTQSPQARNVIATLQSRDHRLGHPQARSQLLLRLARMASQLQKLPRAVRGERPTLIQGWATTGKRLPAGSHDCALAQLRIS
jgi:hypothetical protein